jgi:hypothetical protein
MSTVNSAAAYPLDEEEIATKQHDQVSNDHSQNDPLEDSLGKSLSHVVQVFMTNSLTASTLIDSRKDSDDETGSGSTNPVSSNTDPLSAEIRVHTLGLSAEQKLKDIVENSNSVDEICQRLNFSLPLAQLIDALQWERNLLKFYPMHKGWDIQSEIPSFGKMLYIPSLKDVNPMKIDELEEKLESAQDNLTAKLIKQHAR